MKNKTYLMIVMVVIMLFVVFCGCTGGCNGCNKQIWDGIQRYDRAIIKLPDGNIITGQVEMWNDYDGDQIQVKVDGVWYLVHSNNVVLFVESN